MFLIILIRPSFYSSDLNREWPAIEIEILEILIQFDLIIWTAGVVSAAHAVAVVEHVPGVPSPLDGLQLGVVLPVPHSPVRL